jgi:hypothetical protein
MNDVTRVIARAARSQQAGTGYGRATKSVSSALLLTAAEIEWCIRPPTAEVG